MDSSGDNEGATTNAQHRTRMFGLPGAVDAPLVPGDLAGDYRIERHLADGGMASVYAACHPIIGKHVAVKVLRAAMSKDTLQVERFLREARAVNTIQHPNIVDIFAFGQLADGRQYLVMELLPGETLFARLWCGSLPIERAVTLLLEICDALDAAHAKHIAHLDLKPENIFLVPVGKKTTVKLLDFGIAKLYGTDANEGRDEFVGTPDYASPEQACASPTIDHRSDIYSLGVVAYEMLTGTLPLQGATPVETLKKHLFDVPARPSTHTTIPEALDALVMRMLDKDAAARPSMNEIRETLTRVLEPSVPTRAPVRRRSVLPYVGAAIAASLAFTYGLSHRTTAVASSAPVEVVSQPPERFAAASIVTKPSAELPPAAHARRHHTRAIHGSVDYVLGYDGKVR